MNYREDFRQMNREAWWTLPRALLFFGVSLAGIAAIFFTLSSLGLIGSTAVQRKVFEQSYQRSESINSAIAHERAVLAEIEYKLQTSLDDATRANLEAQAAAARIRLQTKENEK